MCFRDLRLFPLFRGVHKLCSCKYVRSNLEVHYAPNTGLVLPHHDDVGCLVTNMAWRLVQHQFWDGLDGSRQDMRVELPACMLGHTPRQ